MATFPLSQDLSRLHDNCLNYACSIQSDVAAKGGCQSLASEAFNVLTFNAALAHRGIRTLCEAGWAPSAPVVVRTLLDVFASCIAIVSDPANSNYMGFKFMSHFHHSRLTDTSATDPERIEAKQNVDTIVAHLSNADQSKAQAFITAGPPKNYWFQPEYRSTKILLEQSPHPLYDLYRFFSAITHGGFSSKLLFNDFPTDESIDPRAHPKTTSRLIPASSRLLLETSYLRDQLENKGRHDAEYDAIVSKLATFRQ